MAARRACSSPMGATGFRARTAADRSAERPASTYARNRAGAPRYAWSADPRNRSTSHALASGISNPAAIIHAGCGIMKKFMIVKRMKITATAQPRPACGRLHARRTPRRSCRGTSPAGPSRTPGGQARHQPFDVVGVRQVDIRGRREQAVANGLGHEHDRPAGDHPGNHRQDRLQNRIVHIALPRLLGALFHERGHSSSALPTDRGGVIGRSMASRGQHLVRADRRFATGSGLVGRLAAPAGDRVLAEIDRRLDHGGITLTAPGGSVHRLGFRGAGPEATVQLESWLALVRMATSGSVGWYRAWADGEWTSPGPGAVVRAVLAQRPPARRHRPRQGPVPAGQCARAPPPRQSPKHRPGQHRRALRPRQRFLFGLARPDDDLFSARFAAPTSLAEAQRHKVDLLLDRLDLNPASACSRSAAAGAASRSPRRGAARRSSA